jgi:hypothetical protein
VIELLRSGIDTPETVVARLDQAIQYSREFD